MANAAPPLRILMVCTGNICRSAYAHHYLAAALDRQHPGSFVVESAGVGWFRGLEVTPELYAAAPGLHDRLAGHRGRLLDPAMVRAADLVLAVTAEHRQEVLAETPAALKRTFTITEFSQVLAHLGLRPGADPQAWRAAITEIARHRAGVQAADIEDPYGQPQAAYDAMIVQVRPALDVLVEAATGSGQSSSKGSSARASQAANRSTGTSNSGNSSTKVRS